METWGTPALTSVQEEVCPLRTTVNIFLINLYQRLLQRDNIKIICWKWITHEWITLPEPARAVYLKLNHCSSTNMIEKRSIAHSMLLLLKESSIMNIIPLEYMQHSQSLIDSYESQGTASIAIDQFAYLGHIFLPRI